MRLASGQLVSKAKILAESMVTEIPLAPYERLTPELILQAIESVGLNPTGSLLALNSYENRVYQVELEDNRFIVVKFYRPERWQTEAILEEHQFSYELAEQDIPVICPIRYDGNSLLTFAGFRFAVYPRRGGRWPELDDPETLQQLGRLIGRIHAIGRTHRFEYRQRLTVESNGQSALDFLLENDFVPRELSHNFQQAAQLLIDEVRAMFEGVLPSYLRIHGDFHPGNILSLEHHFHFVDLDDCCMGPAIQDLWMMLSGDQHEMASQLSKILEGYETFSEFDYSEIALIEALRGLRLIHYCGWLARRWQDPAFPRHFPWFNTPRYWEEQMITFREQLERCHAPVLKLK
ncbi:MAG: serine/threonine protein kinase [Thioalkalispiraceae bacterium]|jgi:Ser/Thr protein kinase RdoA (MazF antagonist)